MVIISPARRIAVTSKTKCTCAFCGSDEPIVIMPFIPKWTRVDYTNRDNLLPVCTPCYMKYADRFIQLNSMNNLSDVYVQQLMRYYSSWDKYLYKYVMLFHEHRCLSDQKREDIIAILQSYNLYVNEHKEDLNWN